MGRKIKGAKARKVFTDASEEAAMIAVNLMKTSPDEKIKAQMTKLVLEHVIGRPAGQKQIDPEKSRRPVPVSIMSVDKLLEDHGKPPDDEEVRPYDLPVVEDDDDEEEEDDYGLEDEDDE